MEFLKEYAQNIIIVSVLSIVFETIIPEGTYKKYIKVVIGLIVMLAVMQPIRLIAEVRGDFLSLPHFEMSDEYSSFNASDVLAEQFENDLAEKIVQRVREIRNEEIECVVTAGRSDEGDITHIESIKINPYKSETAEFIKKEFGADEVIMSD